MNFKYKWSLKDYPKSHGLKVFSTFACGGGSTMGYKLAGFDVIGANDIDKKMAMIYKKNHKPLFYFLEDIRTFKNRNDLPKELFELDILDGSPPCTTFSMAGKREKSWGEKRKYKEGNFTQTLDDLYFEFIDLANKLKPKVIISENVTGLSKGKAQIYLRNIVRKINEIGYNVQVFQLNSATMGVPQKRERIFIIGTRKNLKLPKLTLEFNYPPIRFGDFRSQKSGEPTNHNKLLLLNINSKDKCLSHISERIFNKTSQFNAMIVKDSDIYPTITATGDNYRFYDKKVCSNEDYINAGSFPFDYDFIGIKPKYVIGMSVPPIMIANIAKEIKNQLFNK